MANKRYFPKLFLKPRRTQPHDETGSDLNKKRDAISALIPTDDTHSFTRESLMWEHKLSSEGNVFSRNRIVLRCDSKGETNSYTWRIPHEKQGVPVMLSVDMLPIPLPYSIKTEAVQGYQATVIEVNLSKNVNDIVIIEVKYCRDSYVRTKKHKLFFVDKSYSWTYRAATALNYFECLIWLPKGADRRVEVSISDLNANSNLVAIDGQLVYSCIYRNVAIGSIVQDTILFREWNSALIPVLSVIVGVFVGIPSWIILGWVTGIIFVFASTLMIFGLVAVIKKINQ